MVKLIRDGFGGLCALLICVAAHGEPKYADPWLGTWVRGDSTLIMEAFEDGIKLVELDPGERVVSFVRMDGRTYPQTDVEWADGIRLRQIDNRTYEYLGTLQGKLMAHSIITFPEDGQTRLSHLKYYHGEERDDIRIWKRAVAKSDEPWYGTWKLGESILIMEPWEDGFTIQFSTAPSEPSGQWSRGSAFGRFDGLMYPETPSNGSDSLVFGRVDDRTITVQHYKNGAKTTLSTITFPADGKTRVSHSTGKNVKGEEVDSTSVWTRVE